MSEDRSRVPYKVAIEAGRASIEAARRGAATLEPRDWSVLLVVIGLTALWSRVEDRVALYEIARLAGWSLPPDDLAPDEHARRRRLVARRASQSLRRLENIGAITYEPGRPGRPDDDGISARHFGIVGVPLMGTELGTHSDDNGYPRGAEKGTQEGPKRGPHRVPQPRSSPRGNSKPPGAPLEAGAVGGAGADTRAVALAALASLPGDDDDQAQVVAAVEALPGDWRWRELLAAVERAGPDGSRREVLVDLKGENVAN